MASAKRYITLTSNPGPSKRPRFPSATAASARVGMNRFNNNLMMGKLREEMNDGHWSTASDVTGWTRRGAPQNSSVSQSMLARANYKLFTQPLIEEAVPDAGDLLFSLITHDKRIAESVSGDDPTLQTTATKAGSLAALNWYLLKHQLSDVSPISQGSDSTESDRLVHIIEATSLHGVVLNEHGTDGRETQLTNGGARALALGRTEIIPSSRRTGLKLGGRISNSKVDRILMVARYGTVPLKNVFSKDTRAGDQVYLVLKRMPVTRQYVLDAKPMTRQKFNAPGDAMRGEYFQYAIVTVPAGKRLNREHLKYTHNGKTYYGEAQRIGFICVIEPNARHPAHSTHVSERPVAFTDASIGRDLQMLQFSLVSKQ